MNTKIYISIGAVVVVFVLAGGIAYYVDPGVINTMFGIDSTQPDVVQDTDLSPVDDASSSLLASDVATDTDVTAIAPIPAKKSVKNKKSSAVSGDAALQADVSQNKETLLSSQQSATTPANSTVDVAGSLSVATSTTNIPSLSSPPPVIPCSFPASAPSTTRAVIFNEIAWMGSSSSSVAEWVELKNISQSPVDLEGWELLNASGKIKVIFSSGDVIPAGGLFLLARGGAVISGNAGVIPKIYSGDLVNGGDALVLMDAQCNASDYLDAVNGWPGGNNTTKATLERNADGVGWHTSAVPGGTPGAENSAGPPLAQYKLLVAFAGDTSGATITSDPPGLICGASCTGNFTSGTKMTLTASAGTGTVFAGWSGSCYGTGACPLTIAADTTLTAGFRSTTPPPPDITITTSPPIVDGGSTATDTTASANTDGGSGAGSSTPAAAHILVAAVQIAGTSSSNDLVKLYNPGADTVDMSGWKLHKRSQTGTDYSLKTFPAGSIVGAGQWFVWANSSGGFSGTVGANVSSTETLAADNSVAVMDAAGNIVDAVAWGTGTGQYGEGPPYPTDPAANQMLMRRMSGGAMADTDNNADDFITQ